MKNTLLTTTALALTGFAGTANAVDIAAGAVNLKISGSFKTTVAASNTKIGAGSDNAGADYDGVDILTNSEIHFKPSITLDNGIKIGADIELEGNTSSDQIDESTIFAKGAFGHIELGSKDSAGKQMQAYAPDVSMVFANSSSLSSFVPFTGPTTFPDFANDADRLTYFTPDFGGLQFGISYARNDSQTNGAVDNNAEGIGTDYADIGMTYKGNFGDVKLGFSARYGTYDRAMGVNAAIAAANTATAIAFAALTAAQADTTIATALKLNAQTAADGAQTAADGALTAADGALNDANTALTAAQTAATADPADPALTAALTAAQTAAQTAAAAQATAKRAASTTLFAAQAAETVAQGETDDAETALTAANTALTAAQTAATADPANTALTAAATTAATAAQAAQAALTDAQTAADGAQVVVAALTDAQTAATAANTALTVAQGKTDDATAATTAATTNTTAAAAAAAAHPTIAGVGLTLGFGAFSIGGGYVEVDEKAGLSKSQAYDIGVRYVTGPMGYSLTYVKSETAGNVADLTSLVAAATYKVNENFKVGASLAAYEKDVAGGTTDDIEGQVLALSAQFSF